MISPIRFIKSLIIRQEGTPTPREIEITPGGNASTRTVLTTSQTANRTISLPDADGTVMLTAGPQTLTNTTIDADNNTITNIDNNEIRAGAAIDATKIADGSVTNTEFQYINSVTSNVQDQLNAGSSALAAHLADTTDAHDASAISVAPTGNLTSTDVQAALEELQDEINNIVAVATPEVRPVTTVNTPGQVLPDDADVVYVDMSIGNFSFVLPANPSEGQIIKIIGQNVDFSFTVFATANVGQLIEGFTLPPIRYQTGFSVRYEGTAWILVSTSLVPRALGITAGYVLTADGLGAAWSAPAAPATPYVTLPETFNNYVAASGTHQPTYYFITSAANATANATYTNNGATFTVVTTISGATLLRTRGTATPLSSGTLTLNTGTGDATITFTSFRAPSVIEVQMVGGGAGGAGGGNSGTSTAGSNTTFGPMTANGAPSVSFFNSAGSGGVGGSGSLGGQPGVVVPGCAGGYGSVSTSGGAGGHGGASSFGGSTAGGWVSAPGGNGVAGTGAGGAGGGGAANAGGGPGGGAGGFVLGKFVAPYTTYAYSTGGGGSGSLAGPGNGSGGNGAGGSIRVTETF